MSLDAGFRGDAVTVVTASPDTTAAEAERLMRERGVDRMVNGQCGISHPTSPCEPRLIDGGAATAPGPWALR
jgi:CBS domain-containing protein